MSNHKEKIFKILISEEFPEKLRQSNCEPNEFNKFLAGHLAAKCSTFTKIQYGHINLMYGNSKGTDRPYSCSVQYEFMTTKYGFIKPLKLTAVTATGVIKNKSQAFKNTRDFRQWIESFSDLFLDYQPPNNMEKQFMPNIENWCIEFIFNKRNMHFDKLSLEEQMYDCLILPHKNLCAFLDNMMMQEELNISERKIKKLKL